MTARTLLERRRPAAARLALAVVLTALSSCDGELDTADFVGRVDHIDGAVFIGANEDAHLIHTARVPCIGCYRSVPSVTDHEMVFRFLVPDGRSFVIKLRAEDLNVDGLRFPVNDVAEPIAQGNVFILPSPPVGEAGAWIGLSPVDRGGAIAVVDAVWPMFPGDLGYATLSLEGLLFEETPIGGAVTTYLAMHREGEAPEGFGNRGEPCLEGACDAGLVCIAERSGLVCRARCEQPTGLCAFGDSCQDWPGVGAVCRPPLTTGDPGTPCDLNVCFADDLTCVADTCRRVCATSGFDPVCGGSSRCEDGVCVATPEVGFTHGPCRENRCDLDNLRCVAESGGPTCRPVCDLEVEGSCEPGFACVSLSTMAGAVCQPI